MSSPTGSMGLLGPAPISNEAASLQSDTGAAGQLMVDGKLTVHAAEAEDFDKANPVKDGAVNADEAAQEAREDAIVKEPLKQKKTVVLVLGGAHDLTDNIRRLTKDCGYTIITPKGFPE